MDKLLYLNAFECQATPVILIDARLRVKHCNGAGRSWLAQLAACPAGDVEGRPLRELLPWLKEDLERFLIRGEDAISFPAPPADAGDRPLWVTLGRLQDSGRMLGVLVSLQAGAEISSREALLQESQRASEERFQQLMEQAPFALSMFNRDGWLVQVNSAWAHLWEVDQIDALLHRFNVLHDSQSRTIGYALAFRQALQGETVDVGEVAVRSFAPRFAGHRLMLHSRVYPLKAGDGQVHTVVMVHEDISERKRLETELKRLASTDSLTGACNRLHFMERAEREFARFRRYRSPLSLLMIDIDHFKSINDDYGHHAGDRVLQQMVQDSRALFRDSDLFGRLGGEEFAVLLPETPLAKAQVVAERLRTRLAELAVELDGRELRFTVSIGVGPALAEDRSIDDLLRRADAALYEAKHGGRNRVVCAA